MVVQMDVHIGYEAGRNVTAVDNISIGRGAGMGYHGVGQTEFQANTTADTMYPSVSLQDRE